MLEDIDLNIDIFVDEPEEDPEIDGSVIVKLRKLVRKIRKSVQMRQKLKKVCESYSMKYLVPVIDVKTRWNSSYHMIQRAQQLRVPLRSLCLNEKSLNNLCITPIEWTELEKIQKLLAKFERSTKLMSMERHATNSSYIPTLNWLIETLTEYADEHSDGLAVAARAGIGKLKKYEDLINATTLPFICTFLNPALKMTYFKEYYSPNAVREINKKIVSYFTESYAPTLAAQSTKRKADDSDETDDFHKYMFKRSKISNEPAEIKNYLNLPLAQPNTDSVEYWKSKVTEFPCLSSMARDFLPIQSSSVSVERDFAGGVDVVTSNRCRLTNETIQAKMCLKSWYKT